MSFKCPFCPRKLATNQGVTSHILQSPTCKEKLCTFYDNLNVHASQTADPTEVAAKEETQNEIDVNMDVKMQSDSPTPPVDVSLDVPVGPEPAPLPEQWRRVTIEEVPDEDNAPRALEEVWVEDYDEEQLAGTTGDSCKTSFQFHRNQQKQAKVEPWLPFESKDKWELARWLVGAGVSQKKIDAHLKLKMVSQIL